MGFAALYAYYGLGLRAGPCDNRPMRREYYDVPLKCPKCGRTGRAQMSDREAYKIEPDYDTKVESVPEGFEITRGGKDAICSKCGVSAL
jgi:hypothetical protein